MRRPHQRLAMARVAKVVSDGSLRPRTCQRCPIVAICWYHGDAFLVRGSPSRRMFVAATAGTVLISNAGGPSDEPQKIFYHC